MYVYRNLNPYNKHVGDCVIRAIANTMEADWVDVYDDITRLGKILKDMPSSNHVWGIYLKNNGYRKHIIPNTCPDCYSVKDFCKDNPVGTFVLGFGGHVATVKNGKIYDSWNSSNEIPIYIWYKKDHPPFKDGGSI